MSILINGVEFIQNPEIGFSGGDPKAVSDAYNYPAMVQDIKDKRYVKLLFGKDTEGMKEYEKYDLTPEEEETFKAVHAQEKAHPGSLETAVWRKLILNDLWFIVTFILKVPGANRPFIVKACQEVENGPDGWTLDLWARVHYKSTIRKARNVQRLLKYPSKCQMIASHTRPAAKDHMRPIMYVLETSTMLHKCFPDILYNDPRSQSPKWSEDDGLIERGHEPARNEPTLMAAGLLEGMKTGHHYDYIDIDDVETWDNVQSVEIISKLRDSIDYGNFLLTEGGAISIWGTPYSHMGAYIPFIRDKVKDNGTPRFLFRKKPATDNGERTGNPVMMKKEELMDLFASLDRSDGTYAADSQLLINPTPRGSERLNPEYLKKIDYQFIPKTVYRFMLIDQAGDADSNKTKDTDAWAVGVFAVEPFVDDIGQSNVYIEDLWVEVSGESEAIDQVVRMYLAGGIITKLGVEKVGQTTTHLHVANALKARGRYVQFSDSGTDRNFPGVLLRPAGRNKKKFIEGSVAWPLNNSKWFYSSQVSSKYIDRLKMEMTNFPLWHDDALNICAYLYDILRDYRFPKRESEEEKIRRTLEVESYNPLTFGFLQERQYGRVI